jgi:hypothetical protein
VDFGDGNFTDMNNAWGIKDTTAASVDGGLTFGDIDGDGDLDIIGYNETFPTRTLNVYRSDPAQQNRLNVRPVGWRAMPAGGVTSRSATASRVRSQSARPLQSVSAWAKEHV